MFSQSAAKSCRGWSLFINNLNVKKLIAYTCLLLGLCMTSFLQVPRDNESGAIKTLIIDAGHGGKDPGAVGKKFYEKDITLKIALQLKRIINENLPDIKVVLTRDTDKFIELHKRGSLAKESNGDFFVSIHCNALVNKTKFGS